MKLFSLAILIYCFSTFTVGNSVTIECKYQMQRWWGTNSEYQCYIEGRELFGEDRVFIEKAEGDHEDGKTNDDVKYLDIYNTNLKYFPRNLENIFKNLELIFIWDSKLIELTSEDLRPFTKLKYFKIEGNPIEIISEDLFIHNPNIEILDIYYNKISHIDRKALSHLNKMRYFRFDGNVCKLNRKQAETKSEVLEMIKEIEEGQC
ncbi:hypothetical protein PVAND_009169 [Polypedilum vanderplanki]|uniref:Uncharacterized protein n=1 Tax=Polypedilum vanderplanki TaxID=319348 RepID=A0A9J6CBT7_POLVA|nr:hypothetical protein PVAND_009169 [Polypedilum vanderplanki]